MNKTIIILFLDSPLVLDAQPHNIDRYYQAILKLCADPQYYLDKYGACAALLEPSIISKNSLGSKLKMVLDYD